uniref:Uncharacterized protein n=1 Tax=Cucumis melo TaxID=3656 RepID=A0A9I9E4X3_CUCME
MNVRVVKPTTTETETGDHHRDGDRGGDGDACGRERWRDGSVKMKKEKTKRKG